MKSANTFVRIVIVLLFIQGCATVKDIQRSTDLIRTDNELARIINDKRPVQGVEKGAELLFLADHAKTQADHLKEKQQILPDAIAYYRIASTAYWQSRKADAVEKFFAVADAGKKLCNKLDKDAPDRDCLFLQLVIPFAGLESENEIIHPQELLGKVNFSDGNATDEELAHMTTIYGSLQRSKRLVAHILSVGCGSTAEYGNRLMTHAGMRDYYCRNLNKVISRYKTNWGGFIVRVKQFYKKDLASGRQLGFTEDDADKLALKVGLALSCCQ